MRKFKIDKHENPVSLKLAPYKKKAFVHKWWLNEIDEENNENAIDEDITYHEQEEDE